MRWMMWRATSAMPYLGGERQRDDRAAAVGVSQLAHAGARG
jgi:hypothetical protein